MSSSKDVEEHDYGPEDPWATDHLANLPVSHMAPDEWLGNLHGGKQVQDLGKGYCGCSGEVKGIKQAA